MQYEKVYPFGYDIIRACSYKFLKKAHFVRLKRGTPWYLLVPYLTHYAVDHNDFGSCFTSLGLSMHMHRFVLVGIEHDDQTEVFV